MARKKANLISYLVTNTNNPPIFPPEQHKLVQMIYQARKPHCLTLIHRLVRGQYKMYYIAMTYNFKRLREKVWSFCCMIFFCNLIVTRTILIDSIMKIMRDTWSRVKSNLPFFFVIFAHLPMWLSGTTAN